MPPQPGWHFLLSRKCPRQARLGTISPMVTPTPFVDVPTALEEIQAGRMIVVVDDENRENEGDLTLAAEFVTPEAINFMARFGRGLICLALTEDRADHLRLRPMTRREYLAFRDSISRKALRPAKESPRESARTIVLTRFAWRSILNLELRTLHDRATFFRCELVVAACWCVPGKRKRQSTWRGWPG